MKLWFRPERGAWNASYSQKMPFDESMAAKTWYNSMQAFNDSHPGEALMISFNGYDERFRVDTDRKSTRLNSSHLA